MTAGPPQDPSPSAASVKDGTRKLKGATANTGPRAASQTPVGRASTAEPQCQGHHRWDQCSFLLRQDHSPDLQLLSAKLRQSSQHHPEAPVRLGSLCPSEKLEMTLGTDNACLEISTTHSPGTRLWRLNVEILSERPWLFFNGGYYPSILGVLVALELSMSSYISLPSRVSPQSSCHRPPQSSASWDVPTGLVLEQTPIKTEVINFLC